MPVAEQDAIEVLGAVSKGRRAKPLPVIIVDQQEKLPLTRYFDPKLVRVQSASLATGDYTLAGASDLLAIERKSLSDLLSCITSDRERFMDQMRRMKDYPSRFLIIEAQREAIEAEVYSRNVRAKSVVNTLVGIAARWNVCVEYRDGPEDAARMVQFICLKVAQLQREGFYDQVTDRTFCSECGVENCEEHAVHQ